MKQLQPFFRESKNGWYLQLGRRQVSLGKDKKKAWKRYHEIMAANKPLGRETTTIEELFERDLEPNQNEALTAALKLTSILI